ncbi:MAG: translocation/assembly module TamB domain-containing protein [Steroidobacteraceae bacterium]
MRRALVIVAVLLLCVVAVVGGAAHWLLHTPAGFAWTLDRLGRLKTVHIATEGAEGLLGEDWRIARMTIAAERVDLVIRGARAKMAPVDWLPLTARATELTIDDVTVRIKPRTTPPSGKPLRFLPAMLHVAVPKLGIAAAHVTLQNGVQLEATQVAADAAVSSQRIDLGRLDVDLREARVRGRFALFATDPVGMEFALDWSTHSSLPVVGRSAGVGDLRQLRTRTNLSAPLVAGIHMTLADLDREFYWTATGRIAELDTQRLSPASRIGRWHGTLRGTGRRLGATLRGELTSDVVDGRPLRYDVVGAYANHGLDFERLLMTLPDIATQVDGGGRLDWTPALHYRFDGQLRRGRWPLAGATLVTVPEARFQVAGWTSFDFTVGGTMLPTGLPGATGGATGRYDGEAIIIDAGRARLLDGDATFAGRLGLGADPAWSLQFSGRALDPAPLTPALPGRVSFDLDARGADLTPETAFEAHVQRIDGRLAGFPVSGAVDLFREQGHFGCRQCRLIVAGATLEADGRANAPRGLSARIDAPDLSKFVAAVHGRGQADLRLGPARAPRAGWRNLRVDGNFAIEDLRLGGLHAGRIAGNADVDLSDASASFVRLRGVGLGYGDRQISSLRLSLDGTSGRHDLGLRFGVGENAVTLKGAGGLAAEEYALDIRELTTAGPRVPAYRLETPGRLLLSRAESSLSPICFRGVDAARICAQGAYRDLANWRVSFDAAALPLKLLGVALPGKPQYQGTFEIVGNAGADGGPWTGTLSARVRGGELSYRRASGKVEAIQLGDIEARAAAAIDGYTASFSTRATDRTELIASARIERGAGDLSAQPLTGSLRLVTNDLGLVPLFVPDIDRAGGRMDAELAAGGTFGAPEFQGSLRLADGEIDFYRTNLRLRAVAATLRFVENTLDIDARAQAGEGRVAVDGRLAWTDGVMSGRIALNGEKLAVIDLPEARILASPDLKLAIDGQRIDVDGTVAVPFARIEPVEIKGAVLTSSDERLVGAEVADTAKPYRINANVRLTLGDDVKLAAFGLSGKLSGSVTARLDAEGAGTGTGELVIDDGKYKAYSRELAVDRGRLVFAGGPLADPGVDMKASRKVPGYTVGVYVRGRLRRPELSFWSEPMLPQSQIASLLIVGRTLDSLQGADRQQLGTSRTQLLAQGGAVLAGQLGRYVGLDEISVEQESAEATSLVIGKFLSPRLYVSYGTSLTEKLNTFKLRYTIGDRWVIKTETGRESAVDIEYAIDR